MVPETSGNYIYGEKFCAKEAFGCSSPAAINRFPDYRLSAGLAKKTLKSASRFDCYSSCQSEKDFSCRAGNYNPASKECQLSDMSRFTLSDMSSLKSTLGVHYFEQNCVYEPKQRCHFRTSKGILPTHVDAYYEIGQIDECRDRCLNASFNCRSYSLLDDKLCLLTHDTEKTRLPYDKELSYLIDSATTFEQTDCFDVHLDCNRETMSLSVNSSRIFNGKIYSKGKL